MQSTQILECACLLLVCTCAVRSQRLNRDNVQLTNNAYQGLIVSIKPKCDGAFNETEAQDMINNLKYYLKEASRELFIATKHRAYLGTVNVYVPDDFPDIAGTSYSDTTSSEEGNIVIDQMNRRYNHRPYVVQPNGCGQPAQYLHLTWEFLMNRTLAKQYGPIGKTLLHELGHLLWGLMDEYLHDQQYFVIPNIDACPETLVGKWETASGTSNCREGETCRFKPTNPQEDEQGRVRDVDMATIMGYHHVDQVSQFCDDDNTDADTLHNPYAENSHNEECRGLYSSISGVPSAWEIMRMHKDFANGNNPAINSNQNTDPDYVFIRQGKQKIVLVLDVSGSMEENNKITTQKNGADYLVESAIKGCHEIGVVKFSSEAQRTQEITSIDTEEDIQAVQSNIPDSADGGTCIGCGILKALEMLGDGKGGTIIVLTDGAENVSPYIDDTREAVLAKQVVVDSILLDAVDGTHPLVNLTQATGGSSYHSTPEDRLKNEFVALLAKRRCDSAKHITTILHNVDTIESDDTRDYHVYVDSTLTDELKVTVTTFSSLAFTTLQIDPPGAMTSPKVHELMGVSDTVIVNVIDRFGEWGIQIKNTGSAQNIYDVLVTATGETSSCDNLPVTITPQYETLVDFNDLSDKGQHNMYCKVSKRASTVTGATVIATLHWIESGENMTEEYTFVDDHTGVDKMANDGIYSASLKFRGNHIYYITFRVTFDGETENSIGGGGGVLNLPNLRGEPDPGPIPTAQPEVNPFRRIQDGGFIQIVNQPPGTEDTDWYPPSQVTDLRAVLSLEGTMSLVFTAVGEDYIEGAAQSYDIRVSNVSSADVAENFTTAMTPIDLDQISQEDLDNLTSGVQAGKSISIPLRQILLEHAQLFYYALRATDSSNNTGEISNLLRVQFPALPIEQPLDTTTVPSDNIDTTEASEVSDDPDFLGGLDPGVLTVIIAVPIVILVSIFTILILQHQKRASHKSSGLMEIEDSESMSADEPTYLAEIYDCYTGGSEPDHRRLSQISGSYAVFTGRSNDYTRNSHLPYHAQF